MAFSSLSDTLINVGKPIVKAIFSTLKDNQDDLNTRLSSVEGLASKRVFYSTPVLGATNLTVLTGLDQIRIEAGIDITDVIVAIYDDASIGSGTLEVDIVKASGAGDGPDFSSSNSIFTTRPSIDFSTASDYDESSNAVLNPTYANGLVEGDYIRLDITSKPDSLAKFFIYCIGEAS